MPRRRYTDNYAATHGRVSAEWRRGNGLPRAAGAGGRAAPSRAQGHLTRWEPRPEARGDARGAGARAGQGPTAPRGSGRGRLRAAAALGAHRLRGSAAPLASPASLPSPAWRGPATPLPAGARKRPVLPRLSPERLPLRALSRLHFSGPNAAAASCHRPSSQHGGCGCLNASWGLRELAPH